MSECIATLPKEKELFEKSKNTALVKKRFSDPDVENVAAAALSDIQDRGRIAPTLEEISEIERVTLDDIHYIAECLSRNKRRTCICLP